MKKIVGAFQGCKSLRSVIFEQGSELVEIGNWTFCLCESLQSICLPDKLRKIGRWAFFHTSLIEVQIPVSVQIIGEGAFNNCRNLSSIVFAEGSQLREIGEEAFSWCKNLKSITIPAAAKVHPEAFKYSSVCITRE